MFQYLNKITFQFCIFAEKIFTMVTTDWKSKATQCSRENKKLKKRIKELTVSRDNWKEKSIRYKERGDNLSTDLKKIKNRLNELIDIP